MTNISKRKLNDEILERLFIQFARTIKSAGKREYETLFMEEFFTKTEKVMFSKRLTIMLILSKGMPQHVVCERLNVSPATVSKITRRLKLGEYDGILEISKGSQGKFFDILIDEILDNLPRPFGRSRGGWGSIYKDAPSFSKQRTRKS